MRFLKKRQSKICPLNVTWSLATDIFLGEKVGKHGRQHEYVGFYLEDHISMLI